jgi:hypothetical protein
LTSAGSTHVRNMKIKVAIDENVDYFTLDKGQSGAAGRLRWDNPGILGGFTVIIDTGEKSCRARHDTDGKDIVSIDNYGGRVYVTTDGAHGLVTGDSVELMGTEDFDGTYHNIIMSSATVFYYDSSSDAGLPSAEGTGGTVHYLQDSWADLTVYDRTDWLLLSPGLNSFGISPSGSAGTQWQDYSINFSWYDHYK